MERVVQYQREGARTAKRVALLVVVVYDLRTLHGAGSRAQAQERDK